MWSPASHAQSHQPTEKELPKVYEEFAAITGLLEKHYHDMQDCEFTIERGKLWMLQSAPQRSGAAAVRVAVEMVGEKLIDRATAVQRVTRATRSVTHPTVDPKTKAPVWHGCRQVRRGAGPGCFQSDEAEELARENAKYSGATGNESDDFHGMVPRSNRPRARRMTSHSGRGCPRHGKPCVSGANSLESITANNNFCGRDGDH